MVVLIGGEKGGTGKTTLATNLAALRTTETRDVMLVDTDRQSSSSHWAAMREMHEGAPAVSCVQIFGKAVTRQVQDLAERYKSIIVDAGGRDSVELRSAMIVADRLYIPVQASQFDVWTLEQMDELVGQAQAVNPSLEVSVVINRASPHPQVREADEAQELLADFEHLTFAGIVLHDRIAFRRAASEGLAVTEMDPADPKACHEIESLYQAVYQEDGTHAPTTP